MKYRVSSSRILGSSQGESFSGYKKTGVSTARSNETGSKMERLGEREQKSHTTLLWSGGGRERGQRTWKGAELAFQKHKDLIDRRDGG
jgi:hypothetical protein